LPPLFICIFLVGPPSEAFSFCMVPPPPNPTSPPYLRKNERSLVALIFTGTHKLQLGALNLKIQYTMLKLTCSCIWSDETSVVNTTAFCNVQ